MGRNTVRVTPSTNPIRDERLLILARAAWIIALGITVLFLICFMPVFFTQLQNPPESTRTALAARSLSPAFYLLYHLACQTIFSLAFIIVGLVIFSRRSNDRIGILTSAFLIMLGGGFYAAFVGNGLVSRVPDNIVQSVFHAHPDVQSLFLALSTFYFVTGLLFFMLFPDGHFVPRWTIWLIPLVIFRLIYRAVDMSDNTIPTIVTIVVALSLIYAQISRYRNASTPAQRQQTKWLILCVGGFIAILVIYLLVIVPLVSAITPVGRPGLLIELLRGFIALTAIIIPFSMMYAILRHHLWDIDLIINRSLVYGSLTLALGLLFILLFFVLQNILGIFLNGEQAPLSGAIAAIVTFLLFSPVRKRARSFVDRRIYGLNFDLYQLRRAQYPLEIKNPGALTGQTIGGYHLHDVLGKGGMGEVYKCTQAGQLAAIKILPANLAEQEIFRHRFEREGQMLTQFHHPNIVKTLGFGEGNGIFYIAMDYINGGSLAEYLKEHGRLNLNTAISLISDIGSALDYAHNHGIIHRDVKPANIILQSDGEILRAVLADFGVAKILDSNSKITNTGAIGTIDYMAPEQIRTANEVDHRTDIYALGVLFYEMLTGECPFHGSLGWMVFAHLNQPPADPRDIRPDLPETVAKSILKALAKKPDERFQSAADFLSTLI